MSKYMEKMVKAFAEEIQENKYASMLAGMDLFEIRDSE